VFDVWLRHEFRGVPFERYADDIICHCRTEREALALRDVLDRRFSECGLELHPQKTKLIYCKDTNRKADHPVIQFDFLGYTFRPRLAKWKGGLFGVSFLPAASPAALKAIRQVVRGWSLQTRSDKALDDLARMFNPYIRGWINYFGHFYKSALYPTLLRIDAALLRWARRKFKRLRQRPRGARNWLARVIRTSPDLFAHWKLLHGVGRTLGAV
jgi:RNA-directed DNA polymerase